MYKMTLLFRNPEDPEQFEDQWAQEFLPFAEQMPGIRRIAVCHVVGEPSGVSNYYKMHEFYFDDREALDRALTSEKGVQAGRGLMAIGGEITTIFFSEVFEEKREPAPNQSSAETTHRGTEKIL